jgi:xanthine/CO dehydrogenase XdhC/CoxF family maturation factor
MATLIAARGGSPRPLGAKLFVGEGGRLLGSVSIGGCVDARVVEHGERLLKENRAQRVTVSVDDKEALELGLACGAGAAGCWASAAEASKAARIVNENAFDIVVMNKSPLCCTNDVYGIPILSQIGLRVTYPAPASDR